MVVFMLLDPEKRIECASPAPEQIRLAGHITPKNNSSGNDFLVLLYRGDEEIARYITRSGRLPSEEEDREGYFMLTAANELGLTRCSEGVEFEQDRAGFDTTYLWRDFTSLEPGTSVILNKDEHRKTYQIIVLPQRVGRYPHEIRLYETYLDPRGSVAINVPIQIYRVEGTSTVDDPTGFYIHDGQLADTPQWSTFSTGDDVQDAWVVDSNPNFTESLSGLESHIIDFDNCGGTAAATGSEAVDLIYFKEVQFQQSPYLNFNPGVAASKAYRTLGFSQGQLDTVTANVPMYAPQGIFRKYKLFWKDVWATGTMLVDFGPSNIRIPFRARIGMTWTIESYDADCPP